MKKLKIIKEIFLYMWKARKWWLYPIILCGIIFGVLIFFAQTTASSPFIYTLF